MLGVLLLGALVYVAFRSWDKVTAFARTRSHLLSLGAVLAILLAVSQVYQSRDAEADDDFLETATASPRMQNVTAESLAASGLAVVSTYHNDNARTGQNLVETVLTPQNVNPAKFGKLYSVPLDGYVYAQPLYIPQVAVPGNGLHNVVIVATQHDSVYAFDSDSLSAGPLWMVNFLSPDAGITTLSPADVNASDILPEIGITSTPAIDVASNTVYVVAATKENGAFYHRLHALDLASGAEKFGGPRTIQATYPGAAQDGHDGVLTFSSRFQLQRAALLLSKGKVYVAFASNADSGLYHGWLIAYDATTLRQSGAWVSTPNGYQGGIWMSGCGIAADNDGTLYLSTANGPFDAYGEPPGVNFSDSIVKLKPGTHGITLTDYFTPYNQAKMAEDDLDLGSAGVMLLPEQPGPYPHLAITSGKDGYIYVLNRDSLGGYNRGKGNPQAVQEIVRPTEAADGNACLLEWSSILRRRHQPTERWHQGLRSAERDSVEDARVTDCGHLAPHAQHGERLRQRQWQWDRMGSRERCVLRRASGTGGAARLRCDRSVARVVQLQPTLGSGQSGTGVQVHRTYSCQWQGVRRRR